LSVTRIVGWRSPLYTHIIACTQILLLFISHIIIPCVWVVEFVPGLTGKLVRAKDT